MTSPRVPLFERLPEIYRLRDAEQVPPGQLEAFVDILDDVFRGLHDQVEEQYHDLFIEHCAAWLIPYLADLVGTSHLSGDPWTLRADVARTVFHRRRKGTLGAVESQVFALSRWASHAIELRERLAWNQHLNHQRPDAGGLPPLRARTDIVSPIRGGMATVRDPAVLSFVGGPFDAFAHVVDVKPPAGGVAGLNLPNLGVFLWRLEDYQVALSKPRPPRGPLTQIVPVAPAPGGATFAVRFELHPQGDPIVLFNTHRFHADDDPPNIATEDTVPGPVAAARLSADTVAGRPDQYVLVQTYSDPKTARPAAGAVGLVLHMPAAPFAGTNWRFRGANLCAWETALAPKLRSHEIAIDPQRGRVVFGVADANQTAEADPLASGLLVSATQGFSGPTGAQPIDRDDIPALWPNDEDVERKRISFFDDPLALQKALDNLPARTRPLAIEITDSMTHDLDLGAVAGIGNVAGVLSLRLVQSLWIRAASGERPVIHLRQPLRFRPTVLAGAGAIDPASLSVRLEGLYLTRQPSFGATDALVMQAATHELRIDGCTLDPGGGLVLDGSAIGTRAPIRTALRLTNDYGLTGPDVGAFNQVPQVVLGRSIAGPLALDTGYVLTLRDSVVDAGSGVGATAPALAVSAATGNPETGWGPDLEVHGITCFGRMRVEHAHGEGGIWVHRLEVHDNQDTHDPLLATSAKGSCIKFSYFSGDADRLPQHHGCVFGTDARLRFTAEWFGRPGYAQVACSSDRRIREGGSAADEMGAFGYLLSSHKWKNIGIRLREFMPVGVRPVLIPVT